MGCGNHRQTLKAKAVMRAIKKLLKLKTNSLYVCDPDSPCRKQNGFVNCVIPAANGAT